MAEYQSTRGRCVVTGVAGFVGSHLAEALLAMGMHVVGVDNFFSGKPENMATFLSHPNFSFYELSITDPGILTKVQDGGQRLTHCFHLAAIVSVPYSLEHEDETFNINYSASMALLEEAHLLGLQRFVFAGSAAEYGAEARMPIREEYAHDGTLHLSPYGQTKYRVSRAVASSPLGVALRFFNIYGLRQDPSSPYSGVISRFVKLAKAGLPLTVHGSGSQSRDFIHISDCVSAYLAGAGLHQELKAATPGCYNIGTGKSTTVFELARTINSLANNASDITHTPLRPGDISHSLADTGAFAAATGWHADVRIEDGLRGLVVG